MLEDKDGNDAMHFDVTIVGGGPAGLAAAIRLKQRAAEACRDIRVCVLEKGAEIGAHILSGAVLDTCALDELISDWRLKDAPLDTPVTDDRFYYLTANASFRIPGFVQPPFMDNRGLQIVSLSNLCRWLGKQAEALGVEIFPGFAAAGLLFDDGGAVTGVTTGEFGRGKDGRKKTNYTPPAEVFAKYTLFAEGARGHLTKTLIARYGLAKDRPAQKYGLGLKELWQIDPAKHRRGTVIHSMGWPLDNKTGGGGFVYHWGEGYCAVGMVIHLDYRNPWLDPFAELQRFKTHPLIRPMLEGGKRIGYGARVVSEGGLQSVPELVFPGGALIGDAAGFMNLPRIKGIHNAMFSGMTAAEAAFGALEENRAGDRLGIYGAGWRLGPVFDDLRRVRNVKPLWSRLGTIPGVLLGGFDMWTNQLFRFSLFGTLRHAKSDRQGLLKARDATAVNYPRPDGVLTFDRASSLYLSGTNHEEDQPVHLRLTDPSLPTCMNLPDYGEPAQRYCPAGVFEIVGEGEAVRLQINAQNCLHCKACDIKDPSHNIVWVAPEGGGGPQYSNM